MDGKQIVFGWSRTAEIRAGNRKKAETIGPAASSRPTVPLIFDPFAILIALRSHPRRSVLDGRGNFIAFG
jgi:hypothetical protein